MRILKGTILLVFVCVFIRIAVGKPCVVPVVWNPLCFAEIVYG